MFIEIFTHWRQQFTYCLGHIDPLQAASQLVNKLGSRPIGASIDCWPRVAEAAAAATTAAA